MRHYGDITQLSGYELPPVDVITGGSPCQDLSVAGKRAGLSGERSGLFMEQIRIVKEMRERDKANGRTGILVRPRYMVWENVPGAFSSKEGKDFAAVIEEIIKVCEVADVCVCVPDGGWPKAGHYYAADGSWSIAWRLHDAQFWGVPQRRKRIALVADFNGLSAAEILFDPKLHGETVYTGFLKVIRDFAERCGRKIQSFRKSLSGDFEPSGTAGEGTAAGTESGADSTICLQGNGIDRSDTAGCNGAGWRRGGVTPLTQSTGQPLSVSENEQESRMGGEVK